MLKQGDDLSERDMQEIQDFVNQHIKEDKAIWLTQILFQAFYFDEESKNLEQAVAMKDNDISQLSAFY